jgi:hypothetical protein
MAEAEPQSFANHRRYDPPYHVFIFLVAAITFLYSLWLLIRTPGVAAAWQVIWNAAFIVLVFRVRGYALKVQDRVIRLEERLRLAALLPEPLKSRVGELSVRQLVGLRFASDAEVAVLSQAALDEKLGGEEIKKRIKTWRPDTFRV